MSAFASRFGATGGGGALKSRSNSPPPAVDAAAVATGAGDRLGAETCGREGDDREVEVGGPARRSTAEDGAARADGRDAADAGGAEVVAVGVVAYSLRQKCVKNADQRMSQPNSPRDHLAIRVRAQDRLQPSACSRTLI